MLLVSEGGASFAKSLKNKREFARGQIVQFASQLFRDKDRLLDARQSCERSFYCPCENMQIHAGSLPKCYFDKMQNGVTTPRTLAIN